MFLIPLILILILACLSVFIIIHVNRSLKNKGASGVKKVVTNVVIILLIVLIFPEAWLMSSAYLQELSGPVDSIRQKISKDYISPEIKIINSIPQISATRSEVTFKISEYPIFKKYGYGKGQILTADKINALPNASSNLFVTHTVGQWNTDTDPSQGYPTSSILLFNKDISLFKDIPLPLPTDPCCDAPLTWIGDRYILVNERYALISSPDFGNHFYIADTQSNSMKFNSISFPESLKQKDYLGISFYPHPKREITALTYCTTTVQTFDNQYCSQSGVSIATPEKISEIFTKNTRNSFKLSWDSNDLYIQEIDKNSAVVSQYSFPVKSY